MADSSMFGGAKRAFDASDKILAKAMEYKNQGNTAVAAGKWPQAALAYKTARMILTEYASKPVEKADENSMAAQMRGKPQLSPEEQKSIDDLNKVLHLNLALVQINLGKFSNAIESANVALFYEPGNPKALYRRGLAHLSKKDASSARSDFKRVLEAVPDDAAAAAKLLECDAVEKEMSEKEKKAFSKMFA